MGADRGRSKILPGGHRSIRLTPRQEEVVGLAANGLTAKEIARRLGLSKRTVDEHFDAARARTGTVSRAELIAWAMASAAVRPAARPEPGRGVAEVRGSGAFTPPAPAPGGARAARAKIAKIPGKRVTDESGFVSNPLRGGTAGAHGDTAAPRAPGPSPRRRGGRPPLITPERAAAARDLLAAGHTIAETARRLRVSRASLYAHLDAITVGND